MARGSKRAGSTRSCTASVSVVAARRCTCQNPLSSSWNSRSPTRSTHGGLRLRADDEPGAALARREDVDVLLARRSSCSSGAASSHRRGRERQVVDRDDGVRAGGERARACPTRRRAAGRGCASRVPSTSSSPASASTDDVGGRGVQLAHAREGVDEHLALELALVGQGDVAELGAAGTLRRIAVDRRRRPRRAPAVLARPRATATVSARQNDFLRSSVIRAHDPLAGDRVGHEDDPPVESRHRDPAVRDRGDVEFDVLALHVTHGSSLHASRRARLPVLTP